MPIQISACPSCGRQLSKSAGIVPQYWCNNCKQGYRKAEVEIRTKYRNLNREKSDKHEKKAAKKIRGRQTIASGAMPHSKADVFNSLVRMECKTTEKQSYSIRKDLLLKVANETEHGKIPVFNVQFEEQTGNLNYYIIDEGWFLELLQLWREHNE